MSVIFIPTDFQVGFLQLLPSLSEAIDNSYTDVILGHLYKAKDYESISWKKSIEFNKMDPQFIEACESVFNRKTGFSVKNFAGSSIAGLKLFFETNHIDLILNPVNYHFKKISKYSMEDPGKIIKRSGYPVHDVHTVYEQEHIIS